MSQVAADFQTQASSAVLAKAGRHASAQQKAPSSRFDDLLSAIPDAPPEPRARARADAPDRPQQTARTDSNKPADRSTRDDRPAQNDRTAKSDSATTAANPKAPATENAPAKDAGATKTAPAATDVKSAEGAATTPPTDGETTSDDSKPTDTTATTQDAVAALVPQTAVIDPVPAVPTAEPTVEGEIAIKPDAAKPEIAAPETKPATGTAKQQAAMVADQPAGLTADDAEVLSALAAKAQQGLKNADGDKADKKGPSDKPVHAAKPNADAAMTDQTVQAVQADGTETNSSDTSTATAKPVESELAKLGSEHQRSQGDGHSKTAAEAVPTAGTINAAAARTGDSFAAHLMASSGHAAPAATAAAAAGRAAQTIQGDKPVAVADVPMEVSAKISSGKNQFDIRLDPEELGRIHVKVNVDRDGNVTTHMIADRRDTLDLLRRDTQGLERALQDAGLKTSDNGLQFSLRDQTQQQQQNQRDGQASLRPAAEDEPATTLTTTVIARDYGRYSLRPSGVDIQV
ncbi:MAG TPA: flagellar hook-length control protein FliK [Pseudolabrys sp.]|nr:flagellar hook-length control protein FliK [Pseudolabrys sp.]